MQAIPRINSRTKRLRSLAKFLPPTLLAVAAPALMHALDAIVLLKLGQDIFYHAALLLPVVVLLAQISASALGGAITTAVARANAEGGPERAAHIVRAGMVVAWIFAVAFFTGFAILAKYPIPWKGGAWALPNQSYQYGIAFTLAAFFIWTSNALAAVLRGFGEFKRAMVHSWLALCAYAVLAYTLLASANNHDATVLLRYAGALIC